MMVITKEKVMKVIDLFVITINKLEVSIIDVEIMAG